MNSLIIASFFLFFGASLLYFVLHDLLIRFEHKNYRDEWIKNGRPIGGIWRAEGFSLKRRKAGIKCVNAWSKKIPQWMLRETRALKMRLWLKVTYCFGFGFWIVLVALLFLIKFGK